MSKICVLVINSGDGTGVNFTRALALDGGFRTVGVDLTVDDFIASEADARHLVEWSGPNDFLEQVDRIARDESADVVYAADTGAPLLALVAGRSRLDAATLLPDPHDHDRMEDKWQTWTALYRAGIPVPDTRLVTSGGTIDAMLAKHGRVWLRRRTGSGGSGSLGTGSSALAAAWIAEHDGWGEFTVSEHLSQRTATFSGVWWDGELIASQLRERTSWKYSQLAASGVTGITSGQKTLWDSDLHAMSMAAVRATCGRPHGAIGVDYTWSVASEHRPSLPLPTEVQPGRFYSSMEFLARVGINLPAIYCRAACGDTPQQPLHNPVREAHFWFKSVDKLPLLFSEDEFANTVSLG